MNPHIEILFSEEEVKAKVEELAQHLAPRLGPAPLMVSLLKGALVFTADLMRALGRRGCPLQLEMMVLSSYGAGTESSGRVHLVLDCREELAGRQVVLVDDILDSGLTMAFAKAHLLQEGAAEVITCVLLDKPARRRPGGIEADLVGFTIPDRFVVGYGIDYAERFRELPHIGAVTDAAAAVAWDTGHAEIRTSTEFRSKPRSGGQSPSQPA